MKLSAEAAAAAVVFWWVPYTPPTLLVVLMKFRIPLRDSNLWLSSTTWALKIEFSASTFIKCWLVMFMLVRIWLLSLLSCVTCPIRSSKCFCFLILDRLADSRLDCILFLFLWSIKTCKSPSDPEFWVGVEEFPLEEAIFFSFSIFNTKERLRFKKSQGLENPRTILVVIIIIILS